MNNPHETQYDAQLFAELYDVQPQAITWLQPVWSDDESAIVDFRFVYANEEALNYFNVSREQFAHLAVSNTPTLTDELREPTLADLRNVYLTGNKSEFAFFNAALKKYSRVLRVRLRNGVLNVIQNITEERQLIHALKENRTLVDNILTASSNGISVGEAVRNNAGEIVDFRTLVANEAACKLTGIPNDLYLSKTGGELDPGFSGSDYFKQCVRCMETGEPFITQYHLEHIGRWLEVSVSKMDEDRQIYVFTDVTPIKEAQLRSERAAERLRAVFNASQSGMFIFSPVKNESGDVVDFRFLVTNPSFASYVGQTPDVLQGELGSTFFPGYLQNGVFDMYKQTYLTGETLRQEVHYHVDQHDLYLDLMSTKVHDDVLVTFADFTSSKRTQLQLEMLVEELRRSNSQLEEFAHAASHDLKEPIRKLQVFTDRLNEGLQDRLKDEERKMFERVQDATTRMALLVDDLLMYSQVSMTQYAMEDLDLNVKVQQVLADLEVAIEEKGARVSIGDLPVVKGYRRQLQQLLQNLLSNALKYGRKDVAPQIAITSSLVDGAETPTDALPGQRYYCLSVKDNGIGFEQQYAEKIFQMFQRLHGKAEYPGTGIGLAIVRKVVENHHGYIWAESEPGKGATFNVLLPVD